MTHSQSGTNMKKNGVQIVLKKSDRVIGWFYDQYDSASSQGNIPADEHSRWLHIPFLLPGDALDLEIRVWTGDHINYVSALKVESGYPVSIPADDLVGMRKNYQAWAGNIPLGDINRDNIGNLNPYQRLVFSESVSYALFSHVLPIEGEDEENSKNQFAAYWNWAKEHLMRKNISTVCSWNYYLRHQRM